MAWGGYQFTAQPFDDRVRYRVSTTGFVGSLPPEPSIMPTANTPGGPFCGPCPSSSWGDPTVTRSELTGDLFLGALVPFSSLSVARRPLHAPDLEPDPLNPAQALVRHAAPCSGGFAYDFPGLAAGPRPPDLPSYGAAEALYFVDASGFFMRSTRSVAAATLGSAWQCYEPCDPPCNSGYPYHIASGDEGPAFERVGRPRGVVIQAGLRAGRLIVASVFPIPSDSPPEITWTDEGGGPVLAGPPIHNPWAQFRLLNRYGPPDPIESHPVAGIVVVGASIPVPGDIAAQFKNTPMIATDPKSPSEVYIAFLGRSTDDAPDEIDMFVAWSNTGNALSPPIGDGPRFQGQVPAAQWADNRRTYRIRDEWLVVPGDPPLTTHQAEQFLQTIVIDDLGGINLLFCQTFECVGCAPSPSTFTVRYARWPSRAALDAGQAPFLHVLSPAPSVPWPMNAGHDYQGITASGCLVYAAWASKDSGEWQVYVSRITLDCTGDADSSGVINTLDPIVFASQFAAQDPEADVNQDGLLNPQDYTDFMAAYACGACPNP